MPEISKTADQALLLLTELAERGPSSTTELSRALGINRTVAHRLIGTLLKRGYVRREGDRYVPGPMVLKVAEGVAPALRAAAQPVMDRLAAESGETVVLHVPDHDQAAVVAQSLGTRHLVRVEHAIGSRHPQWVAASGRALLAFQDDRTIERLLRGVEGQEAIGQKLADAKVRGYEVSHDELQRGVYGIAAPVVGSTGDAVASIAILVPVSREPGLLDHLDGLLVAAKKISDELA